ncbi:helix-turn-helix domain-containing protein [Clostridium botulinum C]|uniref:HTH cro/C1-type domain-containing protein n=1 Tax=Clostridium novyi B str. ATCC 27606 TaxID=1443123 RepID=A0AA40M1T3_CLONO|nr:MULTISPECIES: helix-turn-helix transcriptional regulator [Clostridium]KEI08124.1 hypothetical protein Z958_p0004 [Clostridium novyi B str. NCTC 9691]KEI11465.1 hypothetical protein Z959_p0028 [Clostridium novyi B str. ATCC 27606]MCD3207122.1 helix-turn-helix domain-containing protein [Clostridium botulinum C]MCD3209701.1 helix-turn-helix domain-containing protein [Clostridium botulinum C]MCD3226612.1 helix-turn-helix domain-containing protein [Clostridium botulinum C]
MYTIATRKLINARLKSGLNIKQAAKQSGINRTTIYRLEKGQNKTPQASTLAALAKIYKTDINNLLEEG